MIKTLKQEMRDAGIQGLSDGDEMLPQDTQLMREYTFFVKGIARPGRALYAMGMQEVPATEPPPEGGGEQLAAAPMMALSEEPVGEVAAEEPAAEVAAEEPTAEVTEEPVAEVAAEETVAEEPAADEAQV